MTGFVDTPVEELEPGDEVELPSGVVVEIERIRKIEPELVSDLYYGERFVVDWKQGPEKLGTLAIASAGETVRARRDPEPDL